MTGKPMDPERLSIARSMLAHVVPHGVVSEAFAAELLADRDHHAQRADEILHRSESLCEVEAALRYASHSIPAIRDLGPCEAIGALTTEVARLRARVRVEAEDVERAGVTREHVEAWLRANGWHFKCADGSGWVTYVAPDGLDADLWNTRFGSPVEHTVMFIADHVQRPTFHILDEMAAMEVPS
jgi:hypothetical protein